MNARDKIIALLDAGGPHALFSSEECADDILETFCFELAKEIRDEFPDPNPLASLFNAYLGDVIADYVENFKNNAL